MTKNDVDVAVPLATVRKKQKRNGSKKGNHRRSGNKKRTPTLTVASPAPTSICTSNKILLVANTKPYKSIIIKSLHNGRQYIRCVVEKSKSQCGNLVRATSTIARTKLSASNTIQKIDEAATVRVLKAEESSSNLMDKNKQLKDRYTETSVAKHQVVNIGISILKSKHQLEIQSFRHKFEKSNRKRDQEYEVHKKYITQLKSTLFTSNRTSDKTITLLQSKLSLVN